MKRILSLILTVLLVFLMLPSSFVVSADNTYKKLSSYSDGVWSGSGVSVEAFKMTPSADNMAAIGYTVDKNGEYTFSVELMVDGDSVPADSLNKTAFGFMALERKSNTILYPSSKVGFYSVKNTKINQQTNIAVSGSFTASAGDEIVFIVKNELSATCTLQVVAEIKLDGAIVAANYDGFSETQGKNGWRFYSVAEREFQMPKLPEGGATETTDGFVELKNFEENWWWVNKAGKSDTTSAFYGMAIGTHTQPPAAGFMTARGYKVEKDSVVTFSGTVLLDINKYMNCKEGEDTIGFMVIEKNSNTILYPTDSADFKVFKNTEENRTKPTALSGKYEAKAGDEILFITKNLTKSASPSVQVIMNVSVDGKKVANTHEDFSGTQGAKGWRYYYASNSTFKTPRTPAKDIFSASKYLDERNNTRYLSPEAVSDAAIKSYNTKFSEKSVTVTENYGAALSYKADKNGKFSFSLTAKVKTEGSEIGFAVVKKSNFDFVYPSAKAEYKKISASDGEVTVSGEIDAYRADEYLFVFLPVRVSGAAETEISLTAGGKKQTELTAMFATAEDIYEYMLGSSYTNPSYIEEDAPGFKDIVFDPVRIENFDEEKWMWYVNAWDDPASDGYMAIIMENAQVSTKNYSMIRSYTAQSDCTLSVYGNFSSEIPDFLGANINRKNLEFVICNSKGQIVFPEDRSGFYKFSAAELKPDKPLLINVSFDVTEGEKVYIIFKGADDIDFAYAYTHFQVFETPVGEKPSTPVTGAAEGFSDNQGDNGWNYYYAPNDTFRFKTGTELMKYETDSSESDNQDTQTGTSDKDKNEPENKTVYKVIFIVSAVLDLAAVVLLAVFIILKLKKKEPTDLVG